MIYGSSQTDCHITNISSASPVFTVWLDLSFASLQYFPQCIGFCPSCLFDVGCFHLKLNFTLDIKFFACPILFAFKWGPFDLIIGPRDL